MNDIVSKDYSGTEALSKTRRKKICAELEQLAGELISLSEHELESLSLPEELREQLAVGRAIKKFGARKRHIKYIGSLLRGDDAAVDSIREGLDRLKANSAHAAREHHRVEAWRDRLLSEGNAALSALMAEFPLADRQQLRQLMRKAAAENAAQKPPASARRLYRVLRELLQS